MAITAIQFDYRELTTGKYIKARALNTRENYTTEIYDKVLLHALRQRN